MFFHNNSLNDIKITELKYRAVGHTDIVCWRGGQPTRDGFCLPLIDLKMDMGSKQLWGLDCHTFDFLWPWQKFFLGEELSRLKNDTKVLCLKNINVTKLPTPCFLWMLGTLLFCNRHKHCHYQLWKKGNGLRGASIIVCKIVAYFVFIYNKLHVNIWNV